MKATTTQVILEIRNIVKSVIIHRRTPKADKAWDGDQQHTVLTH